MTLKNRLEYVKATYEGYRQGRYSFDELKSVTKQYVSLHPIKIGIAAIVIVGFAHSCSYATFNAAGVHYQLYPGQHEVQLESRFESLNGIEASAASDPNKAVRRLDDILDWLENHKQVKRSEIVYRQADAAIDEIIEKYSLPDSTRKARESMHLKKKGSK